MTRRRRRVAKEQLTNPTTLLIAGPGTYSLNSDTDYRVQFASTPIPGRVWLVGGRKVHVYGGEITESGEGLSCLIVENIQSECWIEGMVCRKNATHGHCLEIRAAANPFPVTILNCSADGSLGSALTVGDGICPSITVDGFKFVTLGQGISSGGGSYSRLICNRVYGHRGVHPSRLTGALIEIPPGSRFTDTWLVDDADPNAAIASLVRAA